MKREPQRRRSRGALAARARASLVLLALLIQVLVPPGFKLAQPARGDHDALPFAVTICTADGLVELPAGTPPPASESPARDAPEDPDEGPCAYAIRPLSSTPPPDMTEVRVALAGAIPVSRGAQAVVRPGRGASGPPLPARGPPFLLT